MHEWGWQIIDELAEVAKSHRLIPKATFGSFNSDGIVIVGVCTDICVISNALILMRTPRLGLPQTTIGLH